MRSRPPSPKQQPRSSPSRPDWFPYYAGYSAAFVKHVILGENKLANLRVLDPWNGSGTTTTTAHELGVQATGFDLNPVMTLAAKSRLLQANIYDSLESLARELVTHKTSAPDGTSDPLSHWFTPSSAAQIRALERTIYRSLVNRTDKTLGPRTDVDDWSALAAFFYVALFRTLQELTKPFRTANPTWRSTPMHPAGRLRPSANTIRSAFLDQVAHLIAGKPEYIEQPHRTARPVSVATASSLAIPAASGSFELVVTSPPYCTRLDYAIATRIELAMLGYDDATFRAFRRTLLGTTAISASDFPLMSDWGPTCLRLLKAIHRHPSKGSRSYYWPTHLQYFDGLFRSLVEISRVLSRPGRCALVVQDSFYKQHRTDLPRIVEEMASTLGWSRESRFNFPARRNIASVHTTSRQYRNSSLANEAVLTFSLTG